MRVKRLLLVCYSAVLHWTTVSSQSRHNITEILTLRGLVVVVLLVTGDAAMAGVGESVVVLVHHGEALARTEVELLPRETVL